ncbi:MAG: aminopeptidase [Bdellovibrionales bacterium GWC1_52_8]|nr:MAG: aminopeptidase [Bdellovibrionales bacterium GWB1_52_6]OFZ04100.1 MAG: aminopeptidase [Bdellovibrionales bacterium GWA1_52_35]OFZ36619.1 MAG: aminopeptidase [Bdellovibrionales bacterium GWC1_52_8]HCM39813.1 aminopeptidase [Bdellovibrionales bacterium]
MNTDTRLTQLANNIVHYALELKKGQVLYIDMIGAATQGLGKELIRAATSAGAIPYWSQFDDELTKPFLLNASEDQHIAWASFHKAIMERVDAYVGVRGNTNPYDLGDISPNAQKWRQTHFSQEVHMTTRLKKRWVVLRYPNPAMAVAAKKSMTAFEDFYFKVCNLNYSKMSEAMNPLKALMEKTDRVRIVAPGTDIAFSIKGIRAIKCDGKVNIPDGEIYTAPVRESMNGTIRYNTTSFNQGMLFRDIEFVVKNGRIEKFSAPEHMDKLEQIFSSDAGARYFGEFAIGVNPFITDPMNDTLFDEKIKGSIHLTPGNSYDDADNGNRSAVHWDLVLIQTPQYGGGEIWFDDKLIRKDGKFTLPELATLDSDFS